MHCGDTSPVNKKLIGHELRRDQKVGHFRRKIGILGRRQTPESVLPNSEEGGRLKLRRGNQRPGGTQNRTNRITGLGMTQSFCLRQIIIQSLSHYFVNLGASEKAHGCTAGLSLNVVGRGSPSDSPTLQWATVHLLLNCPRREEKVYHLLRQWFSTCGL